MSPPRVSPADACIVAGCSGTRHVSAKGVVMPRCTTHHNEYRRWVDGEHRKRAAAGIAGTPGRKRDVTMPEHLRAGSAAPATVPLPPARRRGTTPKPRTGKRPQKRGWTLAIIADAHQRALARRTAALAETA